MAEPQTIYRLIVLFMLDKVEYPLTNTQITNFILEKDYTSYFTIQQTFTDLLSSDLIIAESTHRNTHYRITEEGKQTLYFFEDKISDAIKNDILAFFQEHHYNLKQENAVYANYYKAPLKGYQVRCQMKEGKKSVIDLTLAVDTREQAEAVCRNWETNYTDLYVLLMDMLIK